MFNKKKDKKKFRKMVEETQFKIETIGREEVNVEVEGTTVGVIYKMAFVLTELMRMGCIDLNDLREMYDIARNFEKDRLKDRKKPNPRLEVMEISGEPAAQLYETLMKCKAGEVADDELKAILENIRNKRRE